MLRKNIFTLVLSGAVLVACGDDSTDDGTTSGDGSVSRADASSVDSSVQDAGSDAATRGVLMSGNYAFSSVSKVGAAGDGCELAFDTDTPDPVALVNEFVGDAGATQIKLGTFRDQTTNPSWTPSGYALGSGGYSSATTADLAANAKVTDTDPTSNKKCTYDLARTVKATLTATNTLQVNFVHTESNRTGDGCDGYPTAPCRSEFNFTLTKSP